MYLVKEKIKKKLYKALPLYCLMFYFNEISIKYNALLKTIKTVIVNQCFARI